MATKNRKFFGVFCEKKSFFARKVYFDVPHAIGEAWEHFRRTQCSWAFSKRSSARSRRAMAVAPMFFVLSVLTAKRRIRFLEIIF